MRIDWHDWKAHFKLCPNVKVDGQLIRNVTMADDVLGVVEYLKANKIKKIIGTVEIIGERK